MYIYLFTSLVLLSMGFTFAFVNVEAQSLTVTNGNFKAPWGSHPAVIMLHLDVDTACPDNVDITITVQGDGLTGPQFAAGTWGPIYYPGDVTKCGGANGKCGATLEYVRDEDSALSRLTFSNIEYNRPAHDSQGEIIPGRVRYFVAIPQHFTPLQSQGASAVGTYNIDQFQAILRTPC